MLDRAWKLNLKKPRVPIAPPQDKSQALDRGHNSKVRRRSLCAKSLTEDIEITAQARPAAERVDQHYCDVGMEVASGKYGRNGSVNQLVSNGVVEPCEGKGGL